MSLVSNTGPLIALAKADALGLLKELFGEVRIPVAVQRELLAKIGVEAQRLDAALNDFVQVEALSPVQPSFMKATQHLGAGEQQAVLLALNRNEQLLIDDRQGRTAARALGVSVTGIVGVLVWAKQSGLIPQVLPVLEMIRQNGYWLSEALLDTAANLAGEIRVPDTD